MQTPRTNHSFQYYTQIIYHIIFRKLANIINYTAALIHTSRNSPAGKPFDFIAMVKRDTQLSSTNNCFNTFQLFHSFVDLTESWIPLTLWKISVTDQFRNHLSYYYSSTDKPHKSASRISMSAFFAAAKRLISILFLIIV